MKQLCWITLQLFLFAGLCAFAQIPVGIPLQSNNQVLGKPGVSMSVAQQTWAIGYSYDTAPHLLGGSPGLAPAGVVRVFEWNGFNFVPKGGPIDSVLVGQYNNQIQILVNPQTLAVSKRSPFGLRVVVYDWDGTEWVARPADVPNAIIWHMGHHNAIATAQPSNPMFPPTSVVVSEWNGTDWTTKGNPINPGQQYRNFGSRLFMPNENMVAIAANGYDERRGQVSVFYWAGFQWQRRGLPIEGDQPSDRFGSDLYMPDGNTIAIGSTGSDLGGTDRGIIKVYDWNGQVWMPRGSPIPGGSETSQIGWGFQMPTITPSWRCPIRAFNCIGTTDPNGKPSGTPFYLQTHIIVFGPPHSAALNWPWAARIPIPEWSAFSTTPCSDLPKPNIPI